MGPNVPSFLLDLLCAKAYDKLCIYPTYAETLFHWFEFLAGTVASQKNFVFDDFISQHQPFQPAHWKVIDPMDDSNNIVQKWNSSQTAELAKWFAKGREQIKQAIIYDRDGYDSESLKSLIELFGPSIKTYCK